MTNLFPVSKVPVHVVHGPNLGGAVAAPLPTDIEVPSLDDLWAWLAPRDDQADAPENNPPEQYYDRGPAVRKGY